MSNYKETAVLNVSKEYLADVKEGSGFGECIVKQLSYELAERIMGILEYEKEIIVRQSDLRVSEFKPTNSVEYRRQIKWSPLVRCKDCKWWDGFPIASATPHIHECSASYPRRGTCADDYCSWGERREDGKI